MAIPTNDPSKSQVHTDRAMKPCPDCGGDVSIVLEINGKNGFVTCSNEDCYFRTENVEGYLEDIIRAYHHRL